MIYGIAIGIVVLGCVVCWLFRRRIERRLDVHRARARAVPFRHDVTAIDRAHHADL